MNMLADISGQHFYYSSIDKLIDNCSQFEKCAIIIDENYLEKFLINGTTIIGNCVDQIIIISADVNHALSQLKEKNVLLLAAGSFEEAVSFTILGAGFFHDVICIPKETENRTKEIINAIKI